MASPFRVGDRASHNMEDISLLKFWTFITHKTGATLTTHHLTMEVPGKFVAVKIENSITWVTMLQRCQNAGWHDVFFSIRAREVGDVNTDTPEVILEYADEIRRIGPVKRGKMEGRWLTGLLKFVEDLGRLAKFCGQVLDWLFMLLLLFVMLPTVLATLEVVVAQVLQATAGSWGSGDGSGQQLG